MYVPLTYISLSIFLHALRQRLSIEKLLSHLRRTKSFLKNAHGNSVGVFNYIYYDSYPLGLFFCQFH